MVPAVSKHRGHVISLAVVVVVVAASGCVRDPVEQVCPDAAVGDLVVTEIRGPQSGGDTYGKWIELYNASGGTIALTGLEVLLRRLDGGAEQTIRVRGTAVAVAAGAYVTLGDFVAGDEPDHIDYGFAPDLDSPIYDSGAIEVYACGELIDTAIYRNLPTTGTWSFGVVPPTAEGNDVEPAWCTDDFDDPDDTGELGIRGTPREENRPCPAI
jgi:hypothetical protein